MFTQTSSKETVTERDKECLHSQDRMTLVRMYKGLGERKVATSWVAWTRMTGGHSNLISLGHSDSRYIGSMMLWGWDRTQTDTDWYVWMVSINFSSWPRSTVWVSFFFQQLSQWYLCGPLTGYTPRCVKHDFGNRLRKTFTGLPFIILNFTPLFICY